MSKRISDQIATPNTVGVSYDGSWPVFRVRDMEDPSDPDEVERLRSCFDAALHGVEQIADLSSQLAELTTKAINDEHDCPTPPGGICRICRLLHEVESGRGQLTECDATIEDLHRIQEEHLDKLAATFEKTLTSQAAEVADRNKRIIQLDATIKEMLRNTNELYAEAERLKAALRTIRMHDGRAPFEGLLITGNWQAIKDALK